jgi:DNA-binding NtrC family response regulator
VSEGRFRGDLYYRLNVLPIWLPPLRERREDIPLLTDHFMHKFFASRSGGVPELSPTVREAFLHYNWPGNVRELENACERIAQTCHCETIRCACMPASILLDAQKPRPTWIMEPLPGVRPVSLDERLHEVEEQLISWALKASHGNKSKAAGLLQIKRSTLGDRIRKLSLEHLERA